MPSTLAPRQKWSPVTSHHEQREKPAAPPPKPQHKHIWATLDGKDSALARLSRQVNLRQGEHIQHKVALCDGCEALQSRITAQFAAFTLTLDVIHADEYLWKVANRLLGETNDQRFEWMAQRTLQMLSGETEQFIRDLRQLAQEPKTTQAQREQLNRTANYFERNLPYMDYPTYLSNGWPIASGVIKSSCRHFVIDRCELSGMRWQQAGAWKPAPLTGCRREPRLGGLLCLPLTSTPHSFVWNSRPSFPAHRSSGLQLSIANSSTVPINQSIELLPFTIGCLIGSQLK